MPGSCAATHEIRFSWTARRSYGYDMRFNKVHACSGEWDRHSKAGLLVDSAVRAVQSKAKKHQMTSGTEGKLSQKRRGSIDSSDYHSTAADCDWAEMRERPLSATNGLCSRSIIVGGRESANREARSPGRLFVIIIRLS